MAGYECESISQDPEMMKGRRNTGNPAGLSQLRRVLYSATGLAVIGSAVAVLGAPIKWA